MQVNWTPLRLAEKTGGAGYGETALSVEDRIKAEFPELKANNKPSVVWLCDISDDKTMKKLDGTIFRNENVGLALKRFNCYRVNVLDMPEGKLKDKYMHKKRLPAFYFFDPAAKPVAKIEGRRAKSLSSFSRYMEKLWTASFTMKLKDYQKKMKDILDRYDKVEGRQIVLDKEKARLEKRPNPAKKRKLEAQEAKLRAQKKKIEEDEQAIFDACTLRPEFLPHGDQNAE